MDKKRNAISAWWAAHAPTKRRLIQLYAALLYNAHARGFIEGSIYTGPLKNLCVPGLNCYSCPGAVGACPLGALQNALASSGARAPYYVLGILLLFGLVLGRVVCGWLCPMGLVQELLHKIPSPKVKKGRWSRALSHLKYAILLVFAAALPLYFGLRWSPVPAFCKYICPAGTLEGALALLAHPENAGMVSMLGALFAGKLFILLLVLAACVFVFRAFCRFLCPLGAIYGLFARISLLGVQVEPAKCISCGLCERRCPVDIRCVGDRECVHCGACIAVCPTKAIRWKGGCGAARGEKTRRRRGAVAAAAAVVLLAGVVAFAHLPSGGPEAVPAAPADDGTPVGFEPGQRAPDFTVPLYAPHEGSFALAGQRGKVVVVNFWATWCAPCVRELPYFAALQQKYAGEVEVIAVHHSLATEDVQAYLDGKDFGDLRFAYDAEGTVIPAYGGSAMLPATVIIGRDGKIVYNSAGSLTYEQLEELIAPCL